ncbi:hypothetical protein Bca101_058902 [Brassica carinata]
MLIKVKGETPTLPEQEDRDTKLVDASKDLNPNLGEVDQDMISGEEQDPNEGVGDKDERTSSQTLSNYGDTQICDYESLS